MDPSTEAPTRSTNRTGLRAPYEHAFRKTRNWGLIVPESHQGKGDLDGEEWREGKGSDRRGQGPFTVAEPDDEALDEAKFCDRAIHGR